MWPFRRGSVEEELPVEAGDEFQFIGNPSAELALFVRDSIYKVTSMQPDTIQMQERILTRTMPLSVVTPKDFQLVGKDDAWEASQLKQGDALRVADPCSTVLRELQGRTVHVQEVKTEGNIVLRIGHSFALIIPRRLMTRTNFFRIFSLQPE